MIIAKAQTTVADQSQTVIYIFSDQSNSVTMVESNNQTYSYYNDSGSYSSNYEQSINKINLLEGLQENS